MDDLFIISKKRLKQLSDAIRAEKLHKKINFWCMARASIFDEDICKMLRDMNFKTIFFGFETGSEKILDYLKVDAISIKQNQQAVDLCSKYGIGVGGYFIAGSPPETYRDLAQSYWFIHRNKKDLFQTSVYCLVPLPGTKVWDDAYEKGKVDYSIDTWNKVNYMELFDEMLLKYEKASADEKYIYLNEQYSFQEFQEAFLAFHEMTQKTPNVYKFIDLQNHLISYKEEIASFISNKLVRAKQRVLEIGEHQPYLLPGKSEFVHYGCRHEYDWAIPAYDLIFINHVLEKIVRPFDFLKKVGASLNKTGKIVVSIYNSCNEQILTRLLKGWTSDLFQVKEFDNFNLFSLNNFQKELKKINIKGTVIKQKSVQEPLTYNLDWLKPLLKADNFLEERQYFSYLLLLEKM